MSPTILYYMASADSGPITVFKLLNNMTQGPGLLIPRIITTWRTTHFYFNKSSNREDLVQQDMVVRLNLGMHNVPYTGDLPNTVFTTAHLGVKFIRLNFSLGDPGRETVNMVRIEYDDGNVSAVHTFGQHHDTCPLDFTPAEFHLVGL